MRNHTMIAGACQRRAQVSTFFRPLAWLAAVLAVLAQGWLTTTPVVAQASKARNVVYVESNDPTGNAILAYSRRADGGLSPLPGSPFSTGGMGITPTFALGPFDSDQNVIVNQEGTLLFAVNGGSDSIATFRINSDGSLTPAVGSPFPSGGSNPVSVGLAGSDILCVVNKDQNPMHPGLFLPNYTTFRVNLRGQLAPIPRSTVYSELGSSPSQALTTVDGRLVFGADFMGGLLRSFQVAANGRLAPADAQPLPSAEFALGTAPPFPLGLYDHPKKPLLYAGFVTINRLGVYRYNRRGDLHFLRTVPNSGKALCWLLVNKAGTRLYTSNTGDPSVSVYDLGDPTEPIEIQRVALRTKGGAFQFALDSTESFLHVVTQQDAMTKDVTTNTLSVLAVGADGKLTEVPSSPTPLPVQNLIRPQGVAAL